MVAIPDLTSPFLDANRVSEPRKHSNCATSDSARAAAGSSVQTTRGASPAEWSDTDAELGYELRLEDPPDLEDEVSRLTRYAVMIVALMMITAILCMLFLIRRP